MIAKKNWLPAAVGCAVLLTMLFSIVGGRTACAQQGQFNAVPSLPRNQNQSGGGSTLEVPANAHQQGGTEMLPPPTAPQQGQELTVAPHELRRQAGYE